MTERRRIAALLALLGVLFGVLTFAVAGPRPEKTCKLVLLGSREITAEDAAWIFPDAFRGCTRVVREH
jgi:hypothetical protein